MIYRFFTVSAAVTLFATSAGAHPGHIDAASHGHSHWLGYAILDRSCPVGRLGPVEPACRKALGR